jgi:uncharacterized membrane protein YkvI
LWPWLGFGLLTSTGTVIERHAANVIKVIGQHFATGSEVMEHFSATVGKVIGIYSATAS